MVFGISTNLQHDAKNYPNMVPKTSQHGAEDKPKPKTSQVGAKMPPRPPKLEPRWPQDPPSWSQDGPKTLQVGAKMAPRPPTWSQDGPKTPQLEAKMPPSPCFRAYQDLMRVGGSASHINMKSILCYALYAIRHMRNVWP